MPRTPGNVQGQQIGSGGFMRSWDGRRVLGDLNQATVEALQRVAEKAKDYWEDEEWTPERHPHMTGNEASILENGFQTVEPNSEGTATLAIGSTSEHTIYEELGTSRQPAHQPIRNTVDRVAYTISDELRRAARRRGY